MPVYEYQAIDRGCPHCERRFEVVHPRTQPPLTVCPECGAPVRKLVSRVSVVKETLGTANLRDKGFTKLVRKEKGVYEKVT